MMIDLDPSGHSLPTSTPTKVTTVTSRVSPWVASLVYPIGRFIVLPVYFGEISVTGRENLPKEGAVILAPTHRSRWDPIMLGYATGRHISGRDLHFMVTVDEMQGLQGWFIRSLGGFPVDTKNPGIASLRHGVELLQNGEMLVIFPEGNIFRENEIQPLKPGLARIALQAESSRNSSGIKVLPISIKYSQPVPHRGCDIAIRIGSPLQVADYRSEGVKKGAQRLTDDLEAALKSLYES